MDRGIAHVVVTTITHIHVRFTSLRDIEECRPQWLLPWFLPGTIGVRGEDKIVRVSIGSQPVPFEKILGHVLVERYRPFGRLSFARASDLVYNRTFDLSQHLIEVHVLPFNTVSSPRRIPVVASYPSGQHHG